MNGIVEKERMDYQYAKVIPVHYNIVNMAQRF